MIFLHFGLLLHFARAKQRKEHAFAVLSMLVWTLYPGWARIVGFSIELHFGIPCGLHAWAGYEFIRSFFLCVGIALARFAGVPHFWDAGCSTEAISQRPVGASAEQHGFLGVCSDRSDPCMPVARLPAVSRIMSAWEVFLLGHHQLSQRAA